MGFRWFVEGCLGTGLLRFVSRAEVQRYVAVGLLLVSSWPTVAWYFARMGDGSDEPWGVLALLAALGFSVRGRKGRFGEYRFLLAAASLLVPLFAGGLLTPLIVSLFVVLAMASLLVDRRCWLGHAGLFVLALPLISSLQFYGGYPLRWLIGKFSSGILSLLGQRVEVQGTAMKWRGELIVIDAPCSGVQMLWASAFLACVMICIQRMGIRKSIMLLQVASVSAFLGNALRNVLLFYLESGLVGSAKWAHDGVGMAVFVVVLSVIVWAGSRLGSDASSREEAPVCASGKRRWFSLAVFVFCLGLWSLFRVSPAERLPEGRRYEGGLAETLERELRREGWFPVRMDERSLRYAKGFPGTIELYAKENRSLVVRVIDRATRRYHLSADCYRALGYKTEPMPILKEVDGTMWGRALASRGDEAVELRERVVSLDGQNWTDPSSWFWSAALGRSQGPWIGYSESVVCDLD